MAAIEITNHNEHLKKLVEASSHSFSAMKNLLDYIINLKESQHSELILEKGIETVTRHSSHIDDSTMYLVEEFFYSALDLKQLDWARLFMQIVAGKFPQTPKAMRMLAMFHEAGSDHDKAKEIYNELVSINPNDTHSVKRLIALERDRGRLNEAITLLNKYLEVNQQDTEAWLELTDIYLSR